jgi:adenosine deaminase
LTWEYLLTCKEQNILHVEIFFDPQTHTKRGIAFGTVITGITKALEKAKEELGISSYLIMCFLRHLSEEEAFETLKLSLPFKAQILGVGLDSSEVGHPPSKFKNVFQACQKEGYKIVAHAGEEGDSSYIWEAIELLHVQRIDHGIRCEEDAHLVEFLKEKQIPLTVCPLSNVKLRAVSTMQEHNILKLLHKGLLVTVNSDDPAYFGGYLNENYLALTQALHINKEELKKLAINSFKASFLPQERKEYFYKMIENIH